MTTTASQAPVTRTQLFTAADRLRHELTVGQPTPYATTTQAKNDEFLARLDTYDSKTVPELRAEAEDRETRGYKKATRSFWTGTGVGVCATGLALATAIAGPAAAAGLAMMIGVGGGIGGFLTGMSYSQTETKNASREAEFAHQLGQWEQTIQSRNDATE